MSIAGVGYGLNPVHYKSSLADHMNAAKSTPSSSLVSPSTQLGRISRATMASFLTTPM